MIRSSVADAFFELVLAIVLVVLVIFVFLRNLPATIIPSISVPVSLIGTLAVMYKLSYSIDNLSLMALIIATGFVVDDSIVMIENIVRYLEEGKTPAGSGADRRRADRLHHRVADGLADRGADPVAVHGRRHRAPVRRICGDACRHDRAFRRRLAHPRADAVRAHPATQGRAPARAALSASVKALFDKTLAAYERGLRWVMAIRPDPHCFSATLVLTGILYVAIPKGLFPVQDVGVIQAISVADNSVSYHDGRPADGTRGRDPQGSRRANLTSYVGIDGTNTTLNNGRFLINLKSHDDRSSTAAEIARRLQSEVADVPGIKLFLQPEQDLTLDTTVSPNQYQFVLRGPSQQAFSKYVPALIGAHEADLLDHGRHQRP